MRIKLVDWDGKLPNLALRKLLAYYREQGDEVGLYTRKRYLFGCKTNRPQKIHISVVFGKDLGTARGNALLSGAAVQIGGPGYSNDALLREEIEHTCPDYEGMEYSMGRTSWGCPRRCPFCMTWRMEGTKTVDHAPLDEFVRHKRIMLYDANFLNAPSAIPNLNRIIDEGWQVNFNQGLDARLVTPETASLLAATKTRDQDFVKNRMYFAWDMMKDEKSIVAGLETLIDNGVKPWRHTWYMLVGYNTTFDQDLYRFRKLAGYGVDPFVMIYNNRRDDQNLRNFAKFVNRRVYKSQSCPTFVDYKRHYRRNKGRGPRSIKSIDLMNCPIKRSVP